MADTTVRKSGYPLPAEKSGRWLCTVLGTLAALLLLPALLVLIVDPYSIFSGKAEDFEVLNRNQRYQNAGLVRNGIDAFNYDTIIVGTSMSENMRPSQIAKTLKIKGVIKLNMSGSQADVKGTVVAAALRNPKVKRVLWEIGADYQRVVRSVRKHKFPYYLYSEDLLSKYQYLFNYDSLKLSTVGPKKGASVSYNDYGRWQETVDKRWAFNRYKKQNFREKIRTMVLKKEDSGGSWGGIEQDLKNAHRRTMLPSLSKFLYPVIESRPDVQFDLFLPPDSCAFYLSLHRLARPYVLREELTRFAAKHNNVRVFGFENEPKMDFCDMRNYKDLRHYKDDFDQVILDSISEGRNELTPDMIDEYLQGMFKKVKHFYRQAKRPLYLKKLKLGVAYP